jgi:hypothetical protein
MALRQVMEWSSPRRAGNKSMSWLKWSLAYLFDCVHPHTTWPHSDRTGFAYICCLDCERELPYSLERMRIVAPEERFADRKRETWHRPWHAYQGQKSRVSLRERPCVRKIPSPEEASRQGRAISKLRSLLYFPHRKPFNGRRQALLVCALPLVNSSG